MICFEEFEKQAAKTFINSESTNKIGKATTAAKMFCENVSDFASDKMYLAEWCTKIKSEEEGEQGALADVLAEITKAREALAGAKICKIIHWNMAADLKDGNYKKKRRDWIKSGKDAIEKIGVGSTLPKIVTTQLNDM